MTAPSSDILSPDIPPPAPPTGAPHPATRHDGSAARSGTVGIMDIGSNSVRLVLYEKLSRSPTTFFNEKVMAGLGQGVARDGELHDEAAAAALDAVKRFTQLARQTRATRLDVIATAATRDASNGQEFIRRVEAISGVKVRILSGREEAEYAAAGVLCGFHEPDGIVGDLGGGSLELIDVSKDGLSVAETFPLGGLRLQEAAKGSPKEAVKIAGQHLEASEALKRLPGRTFYAVGGTWRALARLHMRQAAYPVPIMHHYTIPGDEVLDFCRASEVTKIDSLEGIEAISTARRPLLPYGAAVLDRIVRIGQPRDVVISALGVREGHLYRELSEAERASDPLIEACLELAQQRSRSPAHSRELIGWTSDVFRALGIEETVPERRLREAACLIADVGWRAHPDYRGEQAIAIVANSALYGIDHPGRGYLALVLYYRYAGLSDGPDIPTIREIVPPRHRTLARFLAAVLRVAYVISAAVDGVIGRTRIIIEGERVVLVLPPDLGALDGQRLRRRLEQMSSLLDYASTVVIGQVPEGV